MSIEKIDAVALRKTFLAAALSLDSKKEWINELNVFPVPDGDTGTNMTMTIMTAVEDVKQLNSPDMKSLCKAISSGSLRGARGNSGVILSQLLRGFCKEAGEYEVLDTVALASAFAKATDTAYKAVMKPKEGTILTVARAMSERAMKQVYEVNDIEEFLNNIIIAGDEALADTPNLLPVLKQAGVVDSGGQGLMVAVKGAFDSLTGRITTVELSESKDSVPSTFAGANENLDTADIKFGYCTEFIIYADFTDEDEISFKAYLETMGDSIVCVADDDLVKVHVHTNDPGAVISKALSFGALTRIKVDNMREEHNELYTKEVKGNITKVSLEMPKKHYGLLSVCAGEGLEEIFKGLGADYVIEGGQTMNPSTDDILDAVKNVNAEIVYVFPNNKNIILAANQAAELTEDKKVVVIPTKSIPEGIACMISFAPDGAEEDNYNSMIAAAEAIKTAEVTYAIRDTSIDGFEIAKGDIMVIGEDGMLAVDIDMDTAIMQAIDKLIDEQSELVTLYYGNGVDEEAATALKDKITAKYADVDVELSYGGQYVYYYLISVE